jgi:hypothetical protein
MIPIVTGLILFSVLAWIRHGNGGRLGQHVRRSDWMAWRDAVEDKKRELSELEAAEPKL